MNKLFLILCVLSFTNFAATQTMFQKTIGGAKNDVASSIIQISDGGYIIAGETNSFGVVNRDAYLLALDSLGNLLWSKTCGGGAEDYALALVNTPEGGYLFGAHTASFGHGAHDFYLVKTDGAGDTLWTKLYGGVAPDGIYSLEKTIDKGYILAGHTSSFGAGGHDFYLIKTDSNGDMIWTRTYGGAGSDALRSIKFLEFLGTPSYVMVGETTSFGAGEKDVLIIRINGQGDTLWAKTFGGNSDDYALGVLDSQNPDLSIIVAGHTNSFGFGGMDIYVTKIDSSGEILWSKTYGGVGNEYAYSIARALDGGYIIAGSTTSFGAGEKDVYLIKINSKGDLLWARTFGGPANEVAWSARQSTDGGYIIAGSTTSFGTGAKDIYVIKTDANGFSQCEGLNTNTLSGEAPTITSVAEIITSSGGGIMSSSTSIVGDAKPVDLVICDIVDNLSIVEEQIRVFPNPFSKSTLVEFDYKSGNYTFSLYLATGQLLLEINDINTGQILIDKNDLASGLYFFRLKNNYEIVGSGKLVIE